MSHMATRIVVALAFALALVTSGVASADLTSSSPTFVAGGCCSK